MAFDIVKGDLAPSMPITLAVNGTPVDASTATSVQLHWVKPDGSEFLTTLTPVNAAMGQYKMVWSLGDTDQIGPHRGQVTVTTGGSPQTYPSDGTLIVWWVNPSVTDLGSGCGC